MKHIVEFDMKCPDDTASTQYRESMRYTFEDIKLSGVPSASLKLFSKFWEAHRGQTWEPDGEPPKEWRLQQRSRILGSNGDSSEEARAVVAVEGVEGGLPEGWH